MKLLIKKSTFLNIIIFHSGYLFFKLFGKTPKVFYMSMVNLYCLTNGKFLEKFNKGEKFRILKTNKSIFFQNTSSEDINGVVS